MPARPLKIALCLHGYFPEQHYGTAVYVRQLAQALSRLGHAPTIIAAGLDARASAPRVADPELIDSIPVRRILRPPAASTWQTFEDASMRGPIRQVLEAVEPDVVHVAHFLGLTAAVLTVAAELALPTFATLTDFHGFCHRGTAVDAWGRACMGPNRRRTNCLACGVQDRARENPQSLGLAYLASPVARDTTAFLLPSLTRVLPSALAAEINAVIARPDLLSERFRTVRAALAPTQYLANLYTRNGFARPIVLSPFGVDLARPRTVRRTERPLRVGFIGQIAPHKGCHVLLEALRSIPPDEVSLEIWGDLARHPAYAQRLRTRAAGQPVAFRGTFPLEAIADVLAGLDLLVVPSLWAENAPLTLLQALACKVVVIVSDQPGMTEFVRDGENGFVVPAGDARRLGLAIRAAAADPGKLAAMRARTHFERDAAAMAEDVIAAYRSHGVG
jgi:glycosyltransferase involved in cell wall biosynthesis